MDKEESFCPAHRHRARTARGSRECLAGNCQVGERSSSHKLHGRNARIVGAANRISLERQWVWRCRVYWRGSEVNGGFRACRHSSIVLPRQSEASLTFSFVPPFNGRRVSALPIRCGNLLPSGQCIVCSHEDRRTGSRLVHSEAGIFLRVRSSCHGHPRKISHGKDFKTRHMRS